jgi:hypothetical protein
MRIIFNHILERRGVSDPGGRDDAGVGDGEEGLGKLI